VIGVSLLRRISVMHIINSFLPAGAEKLVFEIAKRMNRESFEVTVCGIVSTGQETERVFVDELVSNGVRVINVAKQPNDQRLHALWRLRRIMRELRVDIVHTHCPSPDFYGRIAAVMASVPIRISTIHNTRGYSPLRERLMQRATTKYVTISRTVRKYAAFDLGIDSSKLETIYNGVEDSGCSPHSRSAIRDFLSLAPDTRLVTAVGRITRQKGLIYLVQCAEDVLKRVPSAHFLIVGDADYDRDYANMLKNTIDALGLKDKFSFTGVRHDVPAIIRASDVIVLPSLWEGLPLVSLESFAAGTPLIATHVGGLAEVVEDGVNGFLVPPGDSRSLGDKLVKVLTDSHLAERLVTSARRKYLQHFSIDRTVARHELLYQRLWRNYSK
jgi:glycosyltransferase involved in cell wall biosynthesis